MPVFLDQYLAALADRASLDLEEMNRFSEAWALRGVIDRQHGLGNRPPTYAPESEGTDAIDAYTNALLVDQEMADSILLAVNTPAPFGTALLQQLLQPLL